jgi:hypothetical protein
LQLAPGGPFGQPAASSPSPYSLPLETGAMDPLAVGDADFVPAAYGPADAAGNRVVLW